jgi:signal recognition particle receptor subunit beta
LRERNLEANDAIIFVVDSADRHKVSDARDELVRILELRDSVAGNKIRTPILILANKQDVPGAMAPNEVSDGLDLKGRLSSCPWHLQPTTALTGAGLSDGLAWLAAELKRRGVEPC